MLPKAIGALVLFAAAGLGAICARLTQQRGGKPLILAEAFASGCLVCASLVHLLPDASVALDDALGQDAKRYPYAAFLCGIGALLAHFANGVTDPLWAMLQEQQEERENKALGVKDREMPISTTLPDEEASESTASSYGQEAKSEGPRHFNAAGPVLLVALTLHSLMEGLCYGASEGSAAFEIFLAILIHKGMAAFALGVAWIRSLPGWRSYLAATFLFALMTPIGILIGQSVEGSLAGSVLTALAAGTFLYVGLIETAPGVRTDWLPGVWRAGQMLASLCGFAALAALAVYV
mmetsp:Transcript_53466/g.124531  ORF Transcript_53466/g.124531 Transcript_53466/m.124531 type:complete len:293 (+) Transcript_53466:53-931(+)